MSVERKGKEMEDETESERESTLVVVRTRILHIFYISNLK